MPTSSVLSQCPDTCETRLCRRPAVLVSVDEQPGGADAQHDVDALRVLGRVQVDTVHGQLLGVLQVVHLGLGRRLTPAHQVRSGQVRTTVVGKRRAKSAQDSTGTHG